MFDQNLVKTISFTKPEGVESWPDVHIHKDGSHIHKDGSHLLPRSLNAACSLGLSATSQQYFSLGTNQPQATSRNQPAVLFSQNKPAPAMSHQPTKQAYDCF
jgi:hypothetical protein